MTRQRTLRVMLFVGAAILGCISLVWAQTEPGGIVGACESWSGTITVVGGAILMIGGLGYAWSEVRNRVSSVEDTQEKHAEALESLGKRDDALDARIDELASKRDEYHHEVMGALERLERK